jgi:hypothetical protein
MKPRQVFMLLSSATTSFGMLATNQGGRQRVKAVFWQEFNGLRVFGTWRPQP